MREIRGMHEIRDMHELSPTQGNMMPFSEMLLLRYG
jgi:hypothetical protein